MNRGRLRQGQFALNIHSLWDLPGQQYFSPIRPQTFGPSMSLELILLPRDRDPGFPGLSGIYFGFGSLDKNLLWSKSFDLGRKHYKFINRPKESLKEDSDLGCLPVLGVLETQKDSS